MKKESNVIGEPLDRVDGRLKVTGGARYSADMPVENVAHAVLITSTVGSGRIQQMDTRDAEHAPGVIAVLTPFNAPRLAKGSIEAQGSNQQSGNGQQSQQGGQSQGGKQNSQGDQQGQQQRRPPDRKIHLLQEDAIFYNGQPIGLVVADTFERARDAASLVKVRYHEERPVLQMERELRRAYKPGASGGAQAAPDSHHGDTDLGWQSASTRVGETYITPIQTHNAMEPHATVAVWEGDHLTLYDATQGIFPARKRVADLFQIPVENVRIISHFVGGGFGSKGPVWSHVVLAAMAARQIGRPVKLELTRHQMFGPVGFRGETWQKLKLAATSGGALTLVQHDGVVETSVFDEFIETVGLSARMMYACPNIATSHRAVRLNIGTPSYTRAPGEAPGMYALESAMDELAYRLNLDPVELRLKNYADVDPESGKPWSSKSLKECYQTGAERFGWSRRTPQPRSMRDGNVLIGYGMATATYPTRRSPASARAQMQADGSVLVQSGSQDI